MSRNEKSALVVRLVGEFTVVVLGILYRWTDHWVGSSEDRRIDFLLPLISDIQLTVGYDYLGLTVEGDETRVEPERATRIRDSILALSPAARDRVLVGLAQ
ncbi:MAG: hypothetical protein ACC682_10620 [Gemmatimonadota bacterium]